MIAILLATYNSEKYIREQIDSLINQKYQDWRLVVRDDLSSDNTVSILREYVDKFPDKISILDNHGESKRAYMNFVDLMKQTESEYYMFCDHDDVWLPEKIEISINKMKEVEKPGMPVIIHTDMKVVDQNLNVIHDSFWAYSRLLPERTSFVEMVLCNSANGCAMLFNQKAKVVSLPNVSNATMHDMLLNQSVAANNGLICAINIPTVLYRQHFDNVVGATERNLFFQLKRFFNFHYLYCSNIENWRRTRRIKNYPFAEYLWVKIKIMFYKIVKYM